MNACEIVSLLLEADVSGGDRTGVYIFGPRLPQNGHVSRDMPQALIHLRHLKVIPPDLRDSTTMIDKLVSEGYTFVIKHDPGNIEVIGKRAPIPITAEGRERLMAHMGLDQDSTVAYKKYTLVGATQKSVNELFYDIKDTPKPEGQRAEGPKPTAKEQAVATREQEVQTAMADFPKTGKGYSGDFIPVNAPVSLGFTFDMDSKEGVIIKEVHPGGPAAQAGLQAGDVIVQTGEFVSREGEDLGPFYVHNQKHLEYVLRKLDPTHMIVFRVIRGDKEVWLPMQAQQKQAEQQQQARQTSMTRKLFANEKRPRQRRLNFKPNEPSPARQTGNQPPNVSSLT